MRCQHRNGALEGHRAPICHVWLDEVFGRLHADLCELEAWMAEEARALVGVLSTASNPRLLGAARTGKGRDMDVSLYDVAMHQLSYPATWYLNEGDVTGRRPRSGHPSVVPCETLPTKDGWIFVMCVLPKFWEALAVALGAPDLPTDPRFATPRARFDNRDALMEIFDPLARRKTTAEWMAEFGGRVPAAPVLTLDQALEMQPAEMEACTPHAHRTHPSGR